MIIAEAVQKMIVFYNGSIHDVNHFLKVWAFAKNIGELEHLDSDTQLTLELAAIVHDIACPMCRETYGSSAGPYQEKEGRILAEEFFRDMKVDKERVERICYLVGHHHTFHDIKGMDYQILVEADFLVNADESHLNQHSIMTFRDKVFQTRTGKELLNSMYQCEKEEQL